ncbi:MAG: alkane 1-monooxygenase, partial [Pseudomonadota bacterium]
MVGLLKTQPAQQNCDSSNAEQAKYQSKRYLWIFSVLIAAAPTLASLLLIATGNQAWAFAPLIFYFGVIPVLDLMFGEDPFNPSDDQLGALADDPYFDGLLLIVSAVFWTNFVVTSVIALSSGMAWPFFVALALGVGAASGAALTVGHELGHRPQRRFQIAALLTNALSGYGHFRIEHNFGHHVNVATPEDSASSRFNESIWSFALREIPGGVARAWRHQSAQLKKRGKPVFSLENEILQGYAISLTVALVLIAAFGWLAIVFILLHHTAAWLQLTFANYVEHYALKRKRRSDGRYEPCAPRHSWNSNHIVSNLSLFHLQRHSDHHAHPNRPYQTLRNFDDLPTLPSGYPGTFVLAAIPPLWFRIMNKKAL